MVSRKLVQILAVACAGLLCTIPALSQTETEEQVRGDNQRTTTKKISARITQIDQKTREITLEGSLGNFITITAGPEIKRFDEFAVGDLVVATYMSSLSGELRAPTEAELAQPFVTRDADAIADKHMDPGAAAGIAIRAVCTIEGMNRVTRTIMLKDPNGHFHIIEDVDPAKMTGVALGDTIVVTYTEAFALTLEKH